jgi:hypothetical protein
MSVRPSHDIEALQIQSLAIVGYGQRNHNGKSGEQKIMAGCFLHSVTLDPGQLSHKFILPGMNRWVLPHPSAVMGANPLALHA